MMRAFFFGAMLTATGLAYSGGALGMGVSKPVKKALSLRTHSYSGGSSSSRRSRRHRSGGFFAGGSSGGGFSSGK